ncbi:MAG TPA: hypothetical protein VM580_31425 [Labilithrix sp.]|nr:hypothetical protein [Labilithrix sp.]
MTKRAVAATPSDSPVWERITPHLAKELTDARGSFQVYLPTPNVCLTRARGYLSLEFARLIPEVLDPHLAEGHSVALFYDWENMINYEAESRRMLTNWGIANVKKLRSIDVLVASRIVALGIATASLAMKLIRLPVYAHPDRASFERALTNAL